MPKINSKCKLCRRAGEKLFLKGERCVSQKCAMVRRPNTPGVHGGTPSRNQSEFGKQLAMKQKIKRIYGVLEKQFRCHYAEVKRQKGVTGDLLLSRLERRMDNVVYRLGFAPSRVTGRQLVSHKMFTVNGKRVNVPSFELHVGDVIRLKDTKREKTYTKNRIEMLKEKKDVPVWLDLNSEKLEGTVVSLPARGDIGVTVDPQMVVEYYSK